MDHHPHGPSASLRSITATVILLGLVVGAAACSNDKKADSPTATLGTSPVTSTTRSTTSTTTLEDVKADVVAAQQAATRAFYEAMVHPDPDDPRLRIHRTGESLANVRDLMRRYASEGKAARHGSNGLPKSVVEEVEVNGRTARVTTCTTDDTAIVRESDGQVLDDDVSSARQRFHLVLDHGDWRISSGDWLGKFEGMTTCG